MGFWDRKVRNGYDSLFDYNRDGRIDCFEQVMQFDFMDQMTKESMI